MEWREAKTSSERGSVPRKAKYELNAGSRAQSLGLVKGPAFHLISVIGFADSERINRIIVGDGETDSLIDIKVAVGVRLQLRDG
jgi:hypothetical protein